MRNTKATRRIVSARAGRTTKTLRIAGRNVSQKRSQVRVEALLNAADKLLQKREASDIGVYDVAHLAAIPPASAYHFFATQESVLVALAERYLRSLHESLRAALSVATIERWPDYVRARYEAVVEFFNQNPVACKLLLNAVVGSTIKELDLADIDRGTAEWYGSMNAIFVMPYVNDAPLKFKVLVGIYDGIWMASFAKYGFITPEFSREGLTAGLAYLDSFLPKTIPLRDPLSKQI